MRQIVTMTSSNFSNQNDFLTQISLKHLLQKNDKAEIAMHFLDIESLSLSMITWAMSLPLVQELSTLKINQNISTVPITNDMISLKHSMD